MARQFQFRVSDWQSGMMYFRFEGGGGRGFSHTNANCFNANEDIKKIESAASIDLDV